MIHFDEAHQRVHFPDDRGIVVVLRRRYIVWLIVAIVLRSRPMAAGADVRHPLGVRAGRRHHRLFEHGPQRGLTRFRTECQGTVCLLHLSGELDSFKSPALDAAIVIVSREHHGTIVALFVECIARE